MAGTVAIATKSKLVGTSSNVLTTALASLTGDDAVTVAYDDPPDRPRRCVWIGNIGGPVELAAMKSGATGRVRRTEDLTLRIHIRCYEPGHRTTEVTDTDAVAISTLVENYIAANPQLDGSVANLKGAYQTGWAIDSYLEDSGATSHIVLTIGLKSFLS